MRPRWRLTSSSQARQVQTQSQGQSLTARTMWSTTTSMKLFPSCDAKVTCALALESFYIRLIGDFPPCIDRHRSERDHSQESQFGRGHAKRTSGTSKNKQKVLPDCCSLLDRDLLLCRPLRSQHRWPPQAAANIEFRQVDREISEVYLCSLLWAN